MSDWRAAIWKQWLSYFSTATTPPQKQDVIKRFFLDIETNAYNNALNDVIFSLEANDDMRTLLPKILKMRMKDVEPPIGKQCQTPPKTAKIIYFPNIYKKSSTEENV